MVSDRDFLRFFFQLASIIPIPTVKGGGQREAGTGVVKFAKWREGFGYIIPDGGGRDLRFQIQDGRMVTAGIEYPEFSNRTTYPPKAGERVIFITRPVSRRGCRSPWREVAVWGYYEHYEAAYEVIRTRPVYQVIQTALYRGAPTTNSRQVVAEGTVEMLGRFNGKLPLKLLDCSYLYRFKRKQGENWVPATAEENEKIGVAIGVVPMEFRVVAQPAAMPEFQKPQSVELKSFDTLAVKLVPVVA